MENHVSVFEMLKGFKHGCKKLFLLIKKNTLKFSTLMVILFCDDAIIIMANIEQMSSFLISYIQCT